MSDVEDAAAPVATEPVAAPEASSNDLPAYDEALLIKVKGKVKRPVKPDDAERNIAVGKLQAEVVKNSEKIKEIKELLDSRRNMTRSVPVAQQEIRKRLEAHRNEFQTVLRQKQHIREELNAAIEQRTLLREEIRSAREKVPRGVNLENLEAKLQEMEFRLSHESVSESEEKRMQQQVTQMTAARPLARSHAIAEAKLKEVDEVRSLVSKRLSECDAVLNGIKAKEEVDRAALEAERSKDKEGENTMDVPALTVEKQECWQMICAYRDKITEIRKTFDEQYREYIKLDKNYNAWLRHDKRKKWEERQKEREERDADRQANDDAATGENIRAELYESEIFTIDQLLTYLRTKVATTEAVQKEEEQKEVEIPKGMKIFKRKEEDEFMVVAKKVNKSGAKPAAAAAASSSSAKPATAAAAKPVAEPAKKKLTHTLEILQTFMTFGIEVPTSAGQMPGTIEKVEAKKANFLELRKKKKEAPKAAAPQANGTHKEAEEEVSASNAAEDAEAEEAEEAKAEEAEAAAAEELAAPAEVEAATPAAAEEAAALPAAEEEVAAPVAEEAPTPAAAEEEVAAPVAAPAPEEVESAAPAAAEEAASGEVSKKAKKKAKKAATAAAAGASGSSGDSSGDIGVSLGVDELSQSVSVKLQLADA